MAVNTLIILGAPRSEREITFDPENAEQVAAAEEKARQYVEYGGRLTKVEGGTATELKEFDPSVEKQAVIMPLQGGAS